MAEEQGSRWYFPVYEGLFDAKHVQSMGPALWLYGWVLSRAFSAQRDGVIAYTHREAADDLGVTYRTVQLWFGRLQEYGYLSTTARHTHHLEVSVTNWRPVEEWLKARTELSSVNSFHSDRKVLSSLEVTGNVTGKESGKVSGNSFPNAHITIRLLGYEYPETSTSQGAGAPGSLAGAFQSILEKLREGKNMAGGLAEVYVLCFGQTAPEYGYLGKVAKAVGGAGRLAEIMWQLSTKPPTGDILGYILKAFGPSRGNGKGKGGPVHDATQTDWQAEAVKWAPKT